jgi:hypothetical membrane protein
MTTGLVGLGICHVLTAIGLRPAGAGGRFLLATGGVATVLVAAFPLPRVGGSGVHGMVAAVAFLTLSLWPTLAWRRGRHVPWALRMPASIAVAVILLGLLGWFAVGLYGHGQRIGLTERLVAGAQALWPLVVVLSVRRVDPSPRAF